MTLIQIRQVTQGAEKPGQFRAVVSFEHGPEHPITIQDPYQAGDETNLAWYFEEYLRFPFTGQVRARKTADSLFTYGERLFKQVFCDTALRAYSRAIAGGVAGLSFEVAGSLAFQRLHWEALKDPDLPRPFVLEAPFVRKNLEPATIEASMRPSPCLNVLLVTARPFGERDVAYRTISRPLVEMVDQARLPVRIDLVRPGTYRALVKKLEASRDLHGPGYYQIVHFDVHGALLDYKQLCQGKENDRYMFWARYGRPDMQKFEGQRAFLFLDGDEEHPADPVEAGELADLLSSHGVPVVMLNACQSGMIGAGNGGANQAGVNDAGDSDTEGKQAEVERASLAGELMQAGVQAALGMAYSVSVTAAECLMEELYQALFDGSELAAGLRLGRLELNNRKDRLGLFNTRVELEDWVLPVLYQNRPVSVRMRPFEAEEEKAFYQKKAGAFPFPQPEYGFVGRDLDVLKIERRLLREEPTPSNMLLVRGMGGAGKTTLLRHLAAWWQTTGLVEAVFPFEYDQKPHTVTQILHAIAKQLLGEAEYYARFVPLSAAEGQAMITGRLRGERHLLILDNLETVTGGHAAVGTALPEDERWALKDFLAGLSGGRTLVLLGSRGEEDWLQQGEREHPAALRAEQIYPLGGLDREAAAQLADRVLERQGVTKYRGDEDLQRLIGLLDGFPLALEVILPNLKRQGPGEVLRALAEGDPGIDRRVEAGKALEFSKTESILKCIDYSHSQLSPAVQELLDCLAPFTGVLNPDWLPQYTELLRSEPALAGLPFEKWTEVLMEARAWGLIEAHSEATGYLRLQPILPYFLRSRMERPEAAERKEAAERAFYQTYIDFGGKLIELLRSNDLLERQVGQIQTRLEYENLITALRFALTTQQAILPIYAPLSIYLQVMRDQRRVLSLAEETLAGMRTYPTERLADEYRREIILLMDDIALSYLKLKQYQQAEEFYCKKLDILDEYQVMLAEEHMKEQAGTLNQLGVVAQEQRHWVQAETYYRQALDIGKQANNHSLQAISYHNLGWVAQEQRQWAQAEENYLESMKIKLKYNFRYEQASTYHNLGVVAAEQRKWEEAEKLNNKALKIYTDHKDGFSLADVYHQFGRVAQEQMQWTRAERYFQKELEIKIEYNNRYSQASAYHQLGVVAQEQQQWAQAEDYYYQARDIYKEYNDRFSQATTYHQLGLLAQEQRKWTEAADHYQKALKFKNEYNDRFSQASTFHNLGLVAAMQRQWTQAGDYLCQALAIFIEYQDDYYMDITLRSLARLWRASRDASLPRKVALLLGNTPEQMEEIFKKNLQEEPEGDSQ